MFKLIKLLFIVSGWVFVFQVPKVKIVVVAQDNVYFCLQNCGLIQCPNGTTCCCRNPCPATCDDPFPNCCDTKCVLNCVTSTTMCKNGWVLDKYNGRCMPLECCPVLRNIHLARCQAPLNGQCLGGPMDSNVTCGTLAPDVCGCPALSDTPKGCLQSACQCAPGYWRRLSDCQCVEKPDCEQCVNYGSYNPLGK